MDRTYEIEYGKDINGDDDDDDDDYYWNRIVGGWLPGEGIRDK